MGRCEQLIGVQLARADGSHRNAGRPRHVAVSTFLSLPRVRKICVELNRSKCADPGRVTCWTAATHWPLPHHQLGTGSEESL